MAFTFVEDAGITGAAVSSVIVPAFTLAVGDLILLSARWPNGGPLPTITDGNADTYIFIGSLQTNTNIPTGGTVGTTQGLWYAICKAAASTSTTITWSGNQSVCGGHRTTFRGGPASGNPVDTYGVATGSGTALSATTTATVRNTGSLVYARFCQNFTDAGTWAIGSGYTNSASALSGNSVTEHILSQASGSLVTATGTGNQAGDEWVGIVAVFSLTAIPPLARKRLPILQAVNRSTTY